jgi:hypothetical protein
MQLVGYDHEFSETVKKAIYRHRGRIIKVSVVSVPANQAELDAQEALAYTAIGLSKTAQTYAEVFLANKAKVFDAISTFGNGWLALFPEPPATPTTPTLQQMKDVLTPTLAIIVTLDDPLVRELTIERMALLLPGAPVSAWTIGECRNWLILLSGWLGRAQALLSGAMVPGSTD